MCGFMNLPFFFRWSTRDTNHYWLHMVFFLGWLLFFQHYDFGLLIILGGFPGCAV